MIRKLLPTKKQPNDFASWQKPHYLTMKMIPKRMILKIRTTMMNIMYRFGYLGYAKDGAAALLTGKGVTAALKQFQRSVGAHKFLCSFSCC